MTVSMVFNDLSLRQPAPNRDIARQWMSIFVQTLKAARFHNLTTLRSHAHFKEMMLSPEYPMQAWFADRDVDREFRQFVLSLSTRGTLIVPYTDDLDADDAIVAKRDHFLASFGDEEAVGLGYTYLFDGVAVSLQSESCWSAPKLTISILEDNTGESMESEVEIRHASDAQHFEEEHRVWIHERLDRSVQNGEDLYNRCAEWFPNLVICDNARRQLSAMPSGALQLHRITERLRDLDNFCRNWTKSGFDGNQIYNASYESTVTMQQYGKQREFVCPDNVIRSFDFHLKGIPNAWRIHIWPDVENRKIFIGYVGKHLDTSRHNN